MLSHPLGNLKIHYVGSLNAGRNPIPFLEALKATNYLYLDVVFVGETAPWTEKIKEYKFCTVVGTVEHKKALSWMLGADILLLILSEMGDPVRDRAVVTGKVYEYIGAGRWIFAIGRTDGDCAELLNKNGLGSICENKKEDILIELNNVVADQQRELDEFLAQRHIFEAGLL